MANASTAVREQLIAQHLQSAAGRQMLASSMTQPLRTRRDYTSVARKAFLVENLPQGALAIYDKDPDVTAYVVGEEGENILSVTKPRRVHVPLFEIASNPEIPLTQIQERRFDLIDRAQELARAEIQAAEDERAFAIMDAVATNGYDSITGLNQTVSVVAPISSGVLADAFKEIEKHDLKVERIFINAADYADFRKFGRDILDPETQRVLLNSGVIGTLWQAAVITSRLVPAGTVYLTCSPEFFGRIPVRQDLTVISADNPHARTVGFSIFENLGIACHNPRGLARLSVTR
jgi:hypothetical protein